MLEYFCLNKDILSYQHNSECIFVQTLLAPWSHTFCVTKPFGMSTSWLQVVNTYKNNQLQKCYRLTEEKVAKPFVSQGDQVQIFLTLEIISRLYFFPGVKLGLQQLHLSLQWLVDPYLCCNLLRSLTVSVKVCTVRLITLKIWSLVFRTRIT